MGPPAVCVGPAAAAASGPEFGVRRLPSSWDGCPAPWGEFEICPCCLPFLPEAALGGREACGSFLLGNAFIW